ncbi:MAG: hypothetical protein VX438_01610, partial [Planctomycetota bacterium]|nr:hypothetical protein [Planctomycetota bacterium]
MNYLGEFFSFDSDMEFHVDVPFYRPVSLNHWATGGDQGWQSVGAYRRYFVDALPAVREIGRGSPNWGVVYEHQQFPPSFQDSFIACDYRWKSATTGGYATSGRLVAFHLKRKGSSWTSGFTELAKAKPGAKDAEGNSINFALVDVDVAPDGSLLVTDHNQGVWRIFYDPREQAQPKLMSEMPLASGSRDRVTQLLDLPQPASEWSRLREESLKAQMDADPEQTFMAVALDPSRSLRHRLRAIRILAPGFQQLTGGFLRKLVAQGEAEIVAQAAWLVAIRGKEEEAELLQELLVHPSAFVRRRAAEGLSRISIPSSTSKLVPVLGDVDRAVSYAAMTALAHRPTSELIAEAKGHSQAKIGIRVLVAAHLRKDRPDAGSLQRMVEKLLSSKSLGPDDQLDLLRVLSLYRGDLQSNRLLFGQVQKRLQILLTTAKGDLRWEVIRLIGQYKIAASYGQLVEQLLNEKDPVTQFHIASSIGNLAKPESGWPQNSADQLTDWIYSTQSGWFAEFAGKGLQFPGFWGTTLSKLCENHLETLSEKLDQLKPGSQVAQSVFSRLESVANAEVVLLDLYRKARDAKAKSNVVKLLQKISSENLALFLVTELRKTKEPELRRSLTRTLGSNGRWLDAPTNLVSALFEFEDADTLAACFNGISLCGKPFSATGASADLQKRFPQFPQVAIGNAFQLTSFRLLELMNRLPGLSSQIEQALITLSGTSPNRKNSPPKVIWSSAEQKDGDKACFVKSFRLSQVPARSEIVLTCDNEYVLFVNGKQLSASNDWTKPRRVDLRQVLTKGNNVIAIEARNQGGPAGLIAVASWQMANGQSGGLVTDSTWLFSTHPQGDWKNQGADKGDWALSQDVSGPTKNAMDAYLAFAGSQQPYDDLVIQEFWNQWYLSEFKTAFVARPL